MKRARASAIEGVARGVETRANEGSEEGTLCEQVMFPG